MLPRLHPLLLGALLLAAALPARSDNGEVAHAPPLKQTKITIDGDLSDWPDAAPRYPLTRTHYQPPRDAEDLEASFRVGYDPDRGWLYLAVEVSDDTHRLDRSAGWRDQDACLVYIDSTHLPTGSGPVMYVVTGARRYPLETRGTWDPAVARGSWESVEYAVRRHGATTTYEYRFDLGSAARPGRTIGFDVVLVDDDGGRGANEPSWLSWGPSLGKSRRAGRCGDVVLMQGNEMTGTLTGSTRWPDGVEGPGALRRIRITSVASPDLWLQAHADEIGSYRVELPPGEYEVTCPFRILGPLYDAAPFIMREDVKVRARVEAGESTVADPLVLSTRPRPELLQEKGVLFEYDGSREKEVDRFIETCLDYYQIPGASVALVKDGRLAYHKTFGVKNAFTGEPVDEKTLFEACSITKIVFAFAVNRIAERGEIDLDKPLHHYLPFPEIAHDDRSRLITARHVLSHRTGLPNWRSGSRLEFKFTPGTGFGYSGEGFEYLGRIVAHLRKKPLEQVLKEEVLIPMGFPRNTYFADTDELVRVVAHGHEIRLPGAALPPKTVGVAHSMHTEARTFSSFMTGLMSRKGLRPETYEAMLRFHSERDVATTAEAVPWKRGFGLGFSLMQSPFGKVYGHAGSNGDFHCLFEIYDEHDAGFIAFANNEMAWTFTELLRKFLVTGKSGARGKNLR